MPDDDYEPDHWQEYKDDLVMGRINEDGSQREPDEPDFAAIEYAEHCDDAHGGAACDCPLPLIEPAQPGDPDYAEEAPF
jgi:hypothetical protein